jgi:four helix bundle protein
VFQNRFFPLIFAFSGSGRWGSGHWDGKNQEPKKTKEEERKMCSKKGFFTIAAWQKADDLTVKIYEVTSVQKGYFPRHQLYSLIQQFHSSAVSVAANIAEGSGRESLAEYIHFLSIAKGSLAEVEYYIHLANRLGYLPPLVHQELEQMQGLEHWHPVQEAGIRSPKSY